jgi:hypothetical protein
MGGRHLLQYDSAGHPQSSLKRMNIKKIINCPSGIPYQAIEFNRPRSQYRLRASWMNFRADVAAQIPSAPADMAKQFLAYLEMTSTLLHEALKPADERYQHCWDDTLAVLNKCEQYCTSNIRIHGCTAPDILQGKGICFFLFLLS